MWFSNYLGYLLGLLHLLSFHLAHSYLMTRYYYFAGDVWWLTIQRVLRYCILKSPYEIEAFHLSFMHCPNFPSSFLFLLKTSAAMKFTHHLVPDSVIHSNTVCLFSWLHWFFFWLFFFLFVCSVVTEPRSYCMIGKGFTTVLYSSPVVIFLKGILNSGPSIVLNHEHSALYISSYLTQKHRGLFNFLSFFVLFFFFIFTCLLLFLVCLRLWIS